jgi:LysM repeat protein
MNATNPFQIPSFAEINREQRRRERFKKTVIAIIVVTALLLVGLLIEGCQSERAALSAPPTPASPPPVASATQPSNPVPLASVATDTSHLPTFYVVKSGDTLTRIARTHGITVKAIESANGLTGDRIVVGTKLTIPDA